MLVLMGGLSACQDRHGGRTAAAGTAAAAPVVADSLALRAPDGHEVWLVAGRTGTGPDGAPCNERLLEIRHEGKRIPVPLLYTGDSPRLVDDSTIEATLWLHCAAGDTYRVNLRTGQPLKHRVAGAA